MAYWRVFAEAPAMSVVAAPPKFPGIIFVVDVSVGGGGWAAVLCIGGFSVSC